MGDTTEKGPQCPECGVQVETIKGLDYVATVYMDGKCADHTAHPNYTAKGHQVTGDHAEIKVIDEPKPGGEKAHHGHMPFALYSTYFLMLQPEFRKHGYALMTHGSGQRDLDMVAVPWGDTLDTPEKVLDHITEKFGFEHNINSDDPDKPWGRKAYIIGCGAGLYIDLSFTPRYTDKT